MRHPLPCLAFAGVIAVAACGGGGGGNGSDGSGSGDGDTTPAASSGAATELVGTFRVDPGRCDPGGTVTEGSYFRMIQTKGTPAAGPYMPNGDSPCADKTWTPMEPGTDGGLRAGAYQPFGDPAFDTKGNGTASAITKPATFFGIAFASATNKVDPQTGDGTTVPRLVVDGEKLSGDLSAFAAAWNTEHFNQGSPKPGGERPGLTSGPAGTYDKATSRYVLDWSSQIVGGAFNNFTGVWHLEGTFEPER